MKTPCMQLVLSVGKKVLDRIRLNPARVREEEYIQAQKRLLITKHELTIATLQGKPLFYVEAASKTMLGE